MTGVQTCALPISFSGTKAPSGNHDGCNPTGGLTLGADGWYWGLAGCGEFGAGVLYRVSAGGSFETVRSFRPNGALAYTKYSGLTALPDGRFIGTTETGGKHGHGTVFTVDPDGNVTVLHEFPEHARDGMAPTASLTCLLGRCWGTTQFGGVYNQGVIFTIAP